MLLLPSWPCLLLLLPHLPPLEAVPVHFRFRVMLCAPKVMWIVSTATFVLMPAFPVHYGACFDPASSTQKCCGGKRACYKFTGKICKDGSCGGRGSCFNASIPIVANSCLTDYSCWKVGYNPDGRSKPTEAQEEWGVSKGRAMPSRHVRVLEPWVWHRLYQRISTGTVRRLRI